MSDSYVINGREVSSQEWSATIQQEINRAHREVECLRAENRELIAALRDLTAECTDDPQEDDWLYQRAIERARAAIAKATGEGT